MDKKAFAKYLDLANHHQDATWADIQKICQSVLEYGFNSAFMNPCYVREAKDYMQGKGKVGTVVSFPLGQELLEVKLETVRKALRDGADELDVSLNVGYFKEGKWAVSEEEMKEIVRQVREIKEEAIVKFIIETGCLTSEEVKKASELVLESGADFIKTCSGMGPRGATLEDVDLIKSAIGEKIKIKVAGGIDTLEEALAFLDRGAVRIGTSHAVGLYEALEQKE